MPHDWKWYYAAKYITSKLIEKGIIKQEDVLMTRGIIQIVLEDRKYLEETPQ